MGDKLTQELFEKCSTEKERESISKNLGDASDWLYDQDDDTKKEVDLSVQSYPEFWGYNIEMF